MRMQLTLASLAATLAATPAMAQNAGGQWQCTYVSRSANNNPTQTWQYQFTLALDRGGQFRAQGSYYALSAGFSVPFQAQGQWRQEQTAVMAQGQEQRQDGYRGPFVMLFTNVMANTMTHQSQNAVGTLAVQCRR